VGVGEQNRLDGHVEFVDGGDEPLGLVSRVDEQRARAVVATEQEGVLRHGPHREHPDVHHAFIALRLCRRL
jgi:hypothetical protein